MTTHPLRVAIMMNSLVRGRMGGTEVYADELVPRLGTEADGLFSVDVLTAGQEQHGSNHETVFLPAVSHGTGGVARFVAYCFNSVFSHKLRSLVGNVDIAFYPFSAVTPALKPRVALVTTIHDLQHRDLPHLFSRAQRIYRWLTYEIPARKANAIVVVSDFTRNSVAETLGVSIDKIHLIYPGIDHNFFHPQLKKSEDVSAKYVYYPARGLSHKNHSMLFSAMELVRVKFPELRLVLSGADESLLGQLPAFVRHEGHVSRERVRELMWGAEALVFPSLYEGFGFPPVEAMAAGCPVVASTAGSLPEVCGGAAELVDPNRAESISQGITAVLENRQGYISKGIKNAARFTWESSSSKHAQLFHSLVKTTA